MIFNFKTSISLLFLLLLLTLQSSIVSQCPEPRRAICILTPDNNSTVSGNVTFTQNYEGVPLRVDFDIKNINGNRSFHIHEFPNITGGCVSAGGHFNPFKMPHGGPNDTVKHAGDLGNLLADNRLNQIKTTKFYKGVGIFGDNTIVHRTCVLHEGIDDYGFGNDAESKKNGNSGKRIACGIIYEIAPRNYRLKKSAYFTKKPLLVLKPPIRL